MFWGAVVRGGKSESASRCVCLVCRTQLALPLYERACCRGHACMTQRFRGVRVGCWLHPMSASRLAASALRTTHAACIHGWHAHAHTRTRTCVNTSALQPQPTPTPLSCPCISAPRHHPAHVCDGPPGVPAATGRAGTKAHARHARSPPPRALGRNTASAEGKQPSNHRGGNCHPSTPNSSTHPSTATLVCRAARCLPATGSMQQNGMWVNRARRRSRKVLGGGGLCK